MSDRRLVLRAADMGDIELRYTRAIHDVFCEEAPKGHMLEEHEPFDDPGSMVPWSEVEYALRVHGLELFRVADMQPVARS